jgi:hypothetical protein
MKPDLKLRYNSSLNINLDKLMLGLNDLNQNMHNFNDILREKISSAILDAETDTLTLQKQLYPTKVPTVLNNKSWFTPELVNLKKQLLNHKKI